MAAAADRRALFVQCTFFLSMDWPFKPNFFRVKWKSNCAWQFTIATSVKVASPTALRFPQT